MELLNDVKDYLRVDGSDEDSVIGNYIDAAKATIKQGTGKAFKEDDAQMLLVLKMLCGHWYDNRGTVGSTEALPFTITALLIQIETREDP